MLKFTWNVHEINLYFKVWLRYKLNWDLCNPVQILKIWIEIIMTGVKCDSQHCRQIKLKKINVSQI